jgi:hypothetical protein
VSFTFHFLKLNRIYLYSSLMGLKNFKSF